MNTTAKSPVRAGFIAQGLRRLAAFRLGSTALSTRAILLSVALTTIVITAVFLTLSIEIKNETKQLLQDMLNRSERQVLSIKEDKLSQLMWVSSQVTNNPTLRAAMETYRLESGSDEETRAALLATLQNEVDKIWIGLQNDLLFVTDNTGAVLATRGREGTHPGIGEDLSRLPVLKYALNPVATVGDDNFGVISLQEHHYLIGSLPIDLQGYAIGTLTIGDRIDSRFLPNLRAFFGGDIVVTVGEQSIASTLPQTSNGDSHAAALADLGATVLQAGGTTRLGNEDFLITSMTLGIDDSGQAVTLHLLRSLTQALQDPIEKLMQMLATQAVLAVLLGALLAWVATRASLRPLERFVEFMKVIAETGDYSRRFQRRLSRDQEQAQDADANQIGAAADVRSHNEFDLLVNSFNGMLAVIEARDSALKKAHTELEAGVRELQQKDRQLRQLQKMEAIGLLAGGVAHDFNNILTVVTGFSELALRSLEQDHEARASIEEVQKASKTASLLTRQLLTLSSKNVIRPKVINLNSLILGLEKILRRVVGESIKLTTELGDDLSNILADPAQIEQVLLNLTVNGRDAIDATGSIRIETALVEPHDKLAVQNDLDLPKPHVMIAVSDDGCGIDDETQARMFEPFFTTKDHGKGTGLGLSTVHGIVTQCGGQIRVESEPGQGTVFKVFLPGVSDAVEVEAQAGQAGITAGSETILVVEDDPDVRRIVCKLLTMSGYRVLETSGPVEALAVFEQNSGQIDLLVTDVIMPVMNGRQLYEKISILRPGIKVLYISGYADGVIDDGGILGESVNFLQKPFSTDALTKKVHRILDKDQAIRPPATDHPVDP